MSSRRRAGKVNTRRHRNYLAFLGHRVSGVLLTLFLPLHFLALGLALEGEAGLDRFLAISELWLVKIAEWGLVVLLALHLSFGLRLLVLELLPWPDPTAARPVWVGYGAGLAFTLGLLFLWQVA